MRKILFVFRGLKNMAPTDVSDLFQMKNNTTDVFTRSSITDIRVANVKTEKSKCKITYSGAALFNSLPTYLKEIINYSYNTYKLKLKNFFLQLNDEVDHLEDFSCVSCRHVVICKCNSR